MNESRPGRAALWMIGAMVSFTAMAVSGRFTAAELDTFELMMYRSLIGIVLVVAFAFGSGTLREITTQKFHLHVLRNIFHFTGQNLWFYAVTVIPLAQLVAFEFTSPIWVLVLAPIFLGERMTKTRALAAGLGFAGIMVVARPGFIEIHSGVIAAAACAIGFAGTMIFTKRLTRIASVTCILFWLTVLQAVMGVGMSGWDGDVTVPSPAVLPWVIVVAVGGLVAHLSVTKALTHAPASIVAPLDFARLPLIALVGMLMFAEPLDPFVFLGAALIFTANFMNVRSESRRRAH